MNNLDLSVIVLSFNTEDITGRCLERLQSSVVSCQNKFKNKIEVIVLDNGSSDNSVQMIKSDYPWVKLISLGENSGFAKGNNIAMKKCRGSFILLLNSDAYLEEESLYKALAYFRVNLNCDVLGARLNYANGNLQPSAGNLPNPVNIISWIFGLRGFHPRNKAYFSKAHQVGWIMGAFFALKRRVFEKTAGFDENLFMYMEEVEWCKRIKDQGFKIWYVPQVEVTHLHGASSNFDLGTGFIREISGINYYLKKHYPIFYLPTRFFLILGLIFRIGAFSLLGKTKRARAYMEGLKII